MVRTAALEPIVEAGHMHLVAAEWNGPFIEEMQSFPGRHDDQVAGLVTLYEGLTTRRQVQVS